MFCSQNSAKGFIAGGKAGERIIYPFEQLQIRLRKHIFLLQASPIRFATCNSKNNKLDEGGSFFINEITIRQYIQQVNLTLSDTQPQHNVPTHSNSWVEVAVVGLGPITADLAFYQKTEDMQNEQLNFLIIHDKQTNRLWFLWYEDELKGKLAKDRCKQNICGCIGGCNFFGPNNNGVRFFTTQPLNSSNNQQSHYGSESLWGTRKESGANIKEHLMRRSEAKSLGVSMSGTSSNLLHRGSSVMARKPRSETGMKKALRKSTTTFLRVFSVNFPKVSY